MDAHSNPRKALKLAQEQEDRRRRRNERDSARRAAETAEQRSERLRKQRERYRARHVAQTASERQATSQQRSPRKHERLMAASWNLVLCPAYFLLWTRLAESLRENWDLIECYAENTAYAATTPTVSTVFHSKSRCHANMATLDTTTCSTCSERFPASLSPKA